MTRQLPPLMSSILATLAFLFTIWTSIDFSEMDRMDYAGMLPTAVALGWTWYRFRKMRAMQRFDLLVLCSLLLASFLLGMIQTMLILRVRALANTDHYDFLAGMVIPVLIAVAAWCFLREKPSIPTAD
jgi:hypothetical protein